MAKRQDKLNQAQLLELFSACIDNSFSLFKHAQEIVFSEKNNKYVSLGIAELALEELGKSYSCIAYYSDSNNKDWITFWKEWRNHLLKAHRGFFYEFFCTFRLEATSPEFEQFFPTYRSSIPMEKEATFYVDIDINSKKIHKPSEEISENECINRVMTLFGLFNSALKVRDLINNNLSSQEYLRAISDYAYLTITTVLYQQQVLHTLNKMESKNEDYNRALKDIKEIFETEDDL